MSKSVLIIVLLAAAPAVAQDTRPVPKDSARVAVVGCTKGYIFTAAPRSTESPGSFDLPEGMHLRMNGPKKVINEIKAHEGSLIELTGLMKKGQYGPGVNIGGGVRVGAPAPGVSPGSPTAGQAMIDVEGWRQATGSCPSR